MGRPEDNLASVIQTLAEKIHVLTVERRNEFEWFKAHLKFATKQDLEKMEGRIMSALSDYVGRVNTAFDKLGTAVDGIAADVAFLKAKIEELQNNPGPITPEDQALLDALEARANTLSDKAAALDAATEQPPPPPPPA